MVLVKQQQHQILEWLLRLGYNTLLVDADIGLRNLDLLLGLENRIIYTGLDVLAKLVD